MIAPMQSAAHEKPLECFGLRADGEADADFAPPLRHRVSQDAVDAHDRKPQRHRSGGGQQNERK